MERAHAVQILVDLKAPDPAAMTARETVRGLLGFGDRLVDLRRRKFYELSVEGDRTDVVDASHAYLVATFELWNPSRERAWARVETGDVDGPDPDSPSSWEVAAGARRPGLFGVPSLDDPRYDHLLAWRAEGSDLPDDLARGLRGRRILAAGSATLYSLRWADVTSETDRLEWTSAVGPVRSRKRGLLVHPAAEHARQFSGAIPCPLALSSILDHAGESA